MTKDTRIVYGAGCTWWDSIDKASKTPKREGISLPCCPYCGSVLFEVPSEKGWIRDAEAHEAKGNPGYVAILKWARGKCFRTFALMRQAYEKEQQEIDPAPSKIE